MSFVGGNMGSTYTGREGFGKAFILPEDDDALKAMGDLLKADQDAKKLKLAKDKAKAERKKKMQTPPEHWRIHSETIQGMTDDLFKLGSDLMAAGIDDPMTSTDPASRQFQEYWSKLANMSNYSTQMKAQFQKDFQLMNAHPEKYTEESMDANRAYYEDSSKKLKEYAEDGTVAPRLIAKEDQIDLQKYMGEMAKNLGTNNADPDFGDFKDMISIGFNDPKNSGFKDAMMDQLHHINNDPIRKAALEAEAKANGVTPLEQLGVQQLESFFKSEPIDIAESIKDFLPAVTEYGTKVEDVAGVTEGTEGYYLSKENLQGAAKAWLDLNPQAVQQLKENNPDLKTKDDVLKWIEDYMKSQVKTKAKTFTTREKDGMYFGYGKKEYDKDKDIWYQAFLGNYPEDGTPEEKYRNHIKAINYLAGSKDESGREIKGGYAMRSGVGDDIDPNLTPSLIYASDANDWNPNRVVLTYADSKDVEIKDDKTGTKTNAKVPVVGKKQIQFYDPATKDYGEKDAMMLYHRRALEAKKDLFLNYLGESAQDTKEDREKISKSSQAKSKAGKYKMGDSGGGSPADNF